MADTPNPADRSEPVRPPAGPDAVSLGVSRDAPAPIRLAVKTPRRPFGTVKIVSGPLHDVREHVINLILSGEFSPGDALPAERELAVRLGVSRPLIREALRSLEAVNIVESRRGAGTYVTDLSPELLMAPLRNAFRLIRGSEVDLFEVRRFLEPQAAAVAAMHMQDDDFSELDRLLDELDRSDQHTFPELDIAFHEWIVRRTNNRLLLSVVRGIRDLEYQVLAITAISAESRKLSAVEHRAIASAIRARDPERAKAAMLLHLARVEDRFRTT
jgi:GntR family transcriptional repressor for pyruvate dehydrogenase complex